VKLRPDVPMSSSQHVPGHFLAERYWPGVDEATAREAIRRFAAEAASDDRVTTTIGVRGRDLRSGLSLLGCDSMVFVP
jgi:hypothetical protein